MRINEACAACLYRTQARRTEDEGYLKEVQALLDGRGKDDTAPIMVWRFDRLYQKRFGAVDDYAAEKRKFNDLVLRMEAPLRARIEAAADPLAAALAMARIGNYIDFAANEQVSTEAFLGLFDGAVLRAEEQPVYRAFLRACADAERFLLIADNAGEIVLDKLLLEQLRARFSRLRLKVLVRGGPVINDVTAEDARYVGIDRFAEIVASGEAIPGTVPSMLAPEARQALEDADVVLAKGQGNYESLSGQGRRVFYLFLCKCDMFTERFQVPRYTGMFLEER